MTKILYNFRITTPKAKDLYEDCTPLQVLS